MSKNIKIHRDTHYMLRMIQDDEGSIDEVVNTLLDAIESDVGRSEVLSGHINIELEESTMRRIKGLAVKDTEPYGSVLRRCLLLYLGLIKD